jgi:hypothetical protein
VKQMVVLMTVDDDVTPRELATDIARAGITNVGVTTAWDWGDFWDDVEESVVGPDFELTADPE